MELAPPFVGALGVVVVVGGHGFEDVPLLASGGNSLPSVVALCVSTVLEMTVGPALW